VALEGDVMASDIPDAHESPIAMAKVLVTYMDDADAIRRVIAYSFDHAPAHYTIRKLRAEHLSASVRPAEAPYKAHEGYYPIEVSKRAADANKRFVIALQRERDYSAAVREAMA
jgi:uncharacterized protein (DUF427 family)